LPLKGKALAWLQPTQRLPLEGKLPNKVRLMRCIQPQLAFPPPAPQRETRSFFPQKKRRH
ncbi:MAG: hypothetical protein IJA59_08785, partial [Clostridia bacterium]|nr:hypothetical protein [Clostridia bacterium]